MSSHTAQQDRPAFIPPGRWEIDRVHSNIAFSIVDPTHLITVSGRFDDFEGILEADSQATAAGAVQVASISTGEPQRDQHLQSADFLNAEKYPQMRFSSHEIEAVAEDRFRIRGALTIQEADHEITLTGKILAQAADPEGSQRVALEADGALDWSGTAVRLAVTATAKRIG